MRKRAGCSRRQEVGHLALLRLLRARPTGLQRQRARRGVAMPYSAPAGFASRGPPLPRRLFGGTSVNIDFDTDAEPRTETFYTSRVVQPLKVLRYIVHDRGLGMGYV